MASRTKATSFVETVNSQSGKKGFLCKICQRQIVSKQNMLHHLFSAHNLSPVKRIKKKYVDDPDVGIPQRTASRLRKKFAADFKTCPESSKCGRDETIHTDPENEDDIQISENEADLHVAISTGAKSSEPIVSEGKEGSLSCTEGDKVLKESDQIMDHEHYVHSGTMLEDISMKSFEASSADKCSSFCSECSSSSECSSGSEWSDINEISSDSTESDTGNFPQILTHDSDIIGKDSEMLSLLSCFLKHNLSASTSKDVLKTFKTNFPDSAALQNITYNKLWSCIDDSFVKEFHYCLICNALFPLETSVTTCSTARCGGFRYKEASAGLPNQGRQPTRSFILADVKRQLENLLKSPGILEDIRKTKAKLLNKDITEGAISDIYDGAAYQTLLQEGRFLAGKDNTNLTASFNTDGIALYSSTKVELWPIFLVINELSPGARFARENILMAGIWQGKGKPPFNQFMEAFSKDMNELYLDGIIMKTNKVSICVKLAVVCGIADLPAKAGLLNMTQYNGANSCITCKEPGETVKQGKGSARHFPHRETKDKMSMRTSASSRAAMEKATASKRVDGFKGLSGLCSLRGFDLVSGIVPDYMHCVLLGVVKVLLHKWFSATESKKDYFIGRSLRVISERLQNIKPPDFVERLPRDLEKNFCNFKATELQTWLLFYALPCLQGILPVKYLQHFSLLSESIYILLGDYISKEAIQRAENMLNNFYKQFADLYGPGSAGLNVHNIGAHMVHYVKLWGPLWAWSCFAFEDANAMLLGSVHGTGKVMRQVIKLKEALGLLRQSGTNETISKMWTNLTKAANCNIAGAIQPLSLEDKAMVSIVTEKVGHLHLEDLHKVNRIVKDGQKFYSSSYTRMKRRQCNVVLLRDLSAAWIHYFVYDKKSDLVFAGISMLTPTSSFLDGIGGRHLIAVSVHKACTNIILVDEIEENLFFISPVPTHPSAYICRLPHVHGRSVFK